MEHQRAVGSDIPILQLQECGENCLGDLECVSKCMHDKDHYTHNCAACMGKLAGCSMANCMTVFLPPMVCPLILLLQECVMQDDGACVVSDV